MKNKIIQLISIAVIAFAGFLTVANATTSLKEIGFTDEEYLERNWERVELATKVENKIMEHYGIKDAFEDTYPSYFGGLYVSDDARNLVIQIVENKIPKEGTEEYKFYKEITTMDNSIKIEFVDYSFNELNEVNNQVSNIVGVEDKLQGEAIGGYIDVMNNTIVVEMKENSIAKQELVKHK